MASKPFQKYMLQVVCHKLQQLFIGSVCHIGLILIACLMTQRPAGSSPGVVGQEFESVEIIHAQDTCPAGIQAFFHSYLEGGFDSGCISL